MVISLEVHYGIYSVEKQTCFVTVGTNLLEYCLVYLITNRYFLEPLTDLQHLKFTLISRFIGFLSQIEKLHKNLPKILLQTIRKDCRSVTVSNIRNIVLMSGKDDTNQLSQSDINKHN